MKRNYGKYVIFGSAGIGAALLQQPLLSGAALGLPMTFYFIANGVIFALAITFCAILTRGNIESASKTHYILGALVLAVGMPVAILAGSISLNVVDLVLPGTRFHLGDIAISFFIAEGIACIVWSFVMFLWTKFSNAAAAWRVLRMGFFATFVIALFADTTEIISKALSQRSLLLPAVSLMEITGSALVLAFGSYRSVRAVITSS